MKTRSMVIAFVACLLACDANAQTQRIEARQLSPAAQQNLVRMEKVDDPEVVSPAPGSSIKPGEIFRVSGKALAQGEVTVRIMPIYGGAQPPRAALLGSDAKYYEAQDFTLPVNAFGSWQTPQTKVLFGKDSTNRKVHIFVAQKAGGVNSQGKVLEYPLTTTVISTQRGSLQMQSFDADKDNEALARFAITSPSAAPMSSGEIYMGNGDFRLQGNSAPGTRIQVEVHFAGKTRKTTYSGLNTHHDDTIHKNKLHAEWTLEIGNDGKWQTPLIKPHVVTKTTCREVLGQKAGCHDDTVSMEKVTAKVTLLRGDKPLSNKTLVFKTAGLPL